MPLNCSISPSAGSASRSSSGSDRYVPRGDSPGFSSLLRYFAIGIVVGAIDYLTGYDVTIYPFYSIPILMMVWFGDMKLAAVISVYLPFPGGGPTRLPATNTRRSGYGFGKRSCALRFSAW